MRDAPESDAPLATQVALLRQSFEGMSGDIAEMKQDFKEFRQFYYTKEQAANLRSELLTAHNNLAKQVNDQVKTAKGFIGGVAVIVVAALVLAYVFHVPAKF